ncbi:hypothetical protein BVC71_02935 [Marivivens niveibacter]|uniref:Uncharacterized protein n=2 Tax=Marivivens niveibacter TaxID=1930667 RepID=A0A251X255_9RHOB|nr:hypothetical protein BVC71_02935 [Marivivens niveibacter]
MTEHDRDPSAELREAQSKFRARQFDVAYLEAQSLAKAFPDIPSISAFASATRKSLNAHCKALIKSGELEKAWHIFLHLSDDTEFAPALFDSWTDAAVIDLPATSVAQCLDGFTPSDSDTEKRKWLTLARIFEQLPSNEKNIELGFYALRHLPGNKSILDGLDHMINQSQRTAQSEII